MQLSPQLESWLNARNISNLDDLQQFMMYSFLGSVTNHNVRDSYIDLNDSQLSKMLEYYRMSVFGSNDSANNMFMYQKEQFDDWCALHAEYDNEYNKPNIFGNF